MLDDSLATLKATSESWPIGNGAEPAGPRSSFLSDGTTPPPAAYPRNFSFYYDYRSFLVGSFHLSTCTFLRGIPQVEGVLFRFPINLLAKESPVFRDMMEVPAPLQTEGLTDENPIHLDGVSNADFVQLLTILAPPQRFKDPTPKLTFDEWTSVLKLSDMWCMDVVKEHAISTMNSLSGVDPVDKVVVARKYGITSWLAPTINAIIQRSQPWNERDVERLGLSTVLKLAEFRDRLQPRSQYGYGFDWELVTQRRETSVDFSGVIMAELPDFQVETPQDFLSLTPSENLDLEGQGEKRKNLKKKKAK
ncbi:hypothetical protein C8R41DRAFT_913946 [Lentinula lateritia]|uniref:BTB domain-containing protein n=1 Tax=Lentinula lateritia TaxID=40482 RepID=A0ABQ8VZ58_9AGAR|nr:hypothetical protein C8R41DRAFT_913946 [Lentinula lateritia]